MAPAASRASIGLDLARDGARVLAGDLGRDRAAGALVDPRDRALGVDLLDVGDVAQRDRGDGRADREGGGPRPR
jgi:hypothetical protein